LGLGLDVLEGTVKGLIPIHLAVTDVEEAVVLFSTEHQVGQEGFGGGSFLLGKAEGQQKAE